MAATLLSLSWCTWLLHVCRAVCMAHAEPSCSLAVSPAPGTALHGQACSTSKVIIWGICCREPVGHQGHQGAGAPS